MPGPAKKPTKLKELEGNPGKRELPGNEPQPSPAMPACPPFLKGAARKEWQRLAPQLNTLGLLTQADRAEFAAYCIFWGQLEEVERELAGLHRAHRELVKLNRKNKNVRVTGSNGLVRITSNGNTIMEPLLSVRKQATEQIRAFGAEFGLSPASRTRISGEPAGQKKRPKSAMEKLLESTRELVN